MSQLRAMQTEAVDRGTLQINVTSSVNAFPVERAEISISYTGVPESTLEKIQTDSSGQTETIELAAPPEESGYRRRQTAIFGIYAEYQSTGI